MTYRRPCFALVAAGCLLTAIVSFVTAQPTPDHLKGES